jgi:hypothetical protein
MRILLLGLDFWPFFAGGTNLLGGDPGYWGYQIVGK